MRHQNQGEPKVEEQALDIRPLETTLGWYLSLTQT